MTNSAKLVGYLFLLLCFAAVVLATSSLQQDGRSADVQWEWTQVIANGSSSSPPGRWGHCVGFHEPSGLMFMFGGIDGSSQMNDLWVYDTNGGGWKQLVANSSGQGPSPRWAPACLPMSEGLMVFGGTDYTIQAARNDTWLFSLSTMSWSLLWADGPFVRFGATPAVSVANDSALFAGPDASVWLWNYGWHLLFQPQGSDPAPPGPTINSQAQAPPDGMYVLDTSTSNLWLFRISMGLWQLVENGTNNGPTPVRYNSITIPYPDGGFTLFGGAIDPSSYLNDVWQWNGSNWTELTTASSSEQPSPREHLGCGYVSGGMLMYGGLTEAGGVNDLWLGTPNSN